MSSNLDRLLAILKEQADLIDKLNTRSDFRYKSTQRLVLEYGQPFITKVKSPFKGQPKSCFENCLKGLLRYPNLNYCEGFAISDNVDIAVSHAWLVNNNGELIDPTWGVGKRFKGSTYFGVVFNDDFVREIAQKTKCYGILDNDYMNEHKLVRAGFPAHALHPQFHQQ
ncbi:hypothetical protein FNW02_33410 [Komarekiella sp. 'clone 1']|uniref:Uncharacterized protein n=1 Tax=Komarekiella delphini-convector SJRDD-AB1 TaxID=2593771 RepID=A0AA40T421_9NOST|nr:hypothetical protein [Komarekiella delphini-convector]MBD6620543.1 hypothetical protein [Komarekiella delphini-convector SJRDD-AB1]